MNGTNGTNGIYRHFEKTSGQDKRDGTAAKKTSGRDKQDGTVLKNFGTG
jgi:hypothetical protein